LVILKIEIWTNSLFNRYCQDQVFKWFLGYPPRLGVMCDVS
jgi:hypothetical protein